MRKTTYEKKMKAHEERFDKLWMKMVEDTNKFLEKNPEAKRTFNIKGLEGLADNLALSGAWLYDRHDRKFPKDRGSMTGKIRKALGYMIP